MLYDFQQEAIDKVQDAFGNYNRVLGVAATGAGKTRIFGALAKAWETQGDQTLIIAHREELIDQSIISLYKHEKIFAQKEKATEYAAIDHAVIVCSIQTLIRPRGDRFNPKYIVIDEAHHALADSYKTVLNRWPNAKVLGVTATAHRGDKKNLGQYFEFVAFEYPINYLCARGYLVKPKVLKIPLQIDLRKCRITTGDYNETDIDEAIYPVLKEAAREIINNRHGRKTLVFLPLIRTAKLFSEICNAELGCQGKCDYVSGESKDRRERLDNFKSGQTEILANAMLLTEGFDDPSIQNIVCLRPTKSLSLYQQIIGRGCRVLPDTINGQDTDAVRLASILLSDKPDLLITDFLWITERHSLITPAHLVAQSDEEAKRINKVIDDIFDHREFLQNKTPVFDLEETQQQAELEFEEEIHQAHEREKSLAKALHKNKDKKKQLVDPLEFALSLHMQSLLDYEPEMAWESSPVTEHQKNELRKVQFDVGQIKYCGHAAMIIATMKKRFAMRLATPRQVTWLMHFHHPNPNTCTMTEASAFLDTKFKKKV